MRRNHKRNMNKKTRYYTDGFSVWKFPTEGHPQYREPHSSEWEDSEFASLAAFKEAPGNVREISEKEVEP